MGELREQPQTFYSTGMPEDILHTGSDSELYQMMTNDLSFYERFFSFASVVAFGSLLKMGLFGWPFRSTVSNF